MLCWINLHHKVPLQVSFLDVRLNLLAANNIQWVPENCFTLKWACLKMLYSAFLGIIPQDVAVTFEIHIALASTCNTMMEKSHTVKSTDETLKRVLKLSGIHACHKFFYPHPPINVLLSRLWIVSGQCTTTDGSAVGFCWWFILMDLTPIPPFLFLLPIFLSPVPPTAHSLSHAFQTPRRQMDQHSTSHHLAFQGC